jgi:adenylate cyclase class 2
MKEVEILVEVKSSKEEVLKILEKFNFVGEKEVLDIYFYNENNEKLKPINGELKECFRLRKKDGKNYITYKIDHFKDGKWVYSDEEETKVDDFEIMLKIVSQLGFKPLVEIDNIKHTFLTDKYEIVLEEVKNLGLFLEVERLVVGDNEDVHVVKEEIFDFIKSLNINVGEESTAGKPELMLRKKI